MSNRLCLSPKGIQQVDRARLAKGWKKQDSQWWQTAEVSLATLKRFLAAHPVDEFTLCKLCRAIDLPTVEILDPATNTPTTYTIPFPQPLPTPTATPTKPRHNLPRKPAPFIGRTEEIQKLKTYLSPDRATPIIVVVSGIGGVGKTTLVLHIAYDCLTPAPAPASPHFDTIIFVSAKQNHLLPLGILPRSKRYQTLDDILRVISKTLNEQSITQEPEEPEKADRAYQALTRQKTLLIIDNLETIEDEEVQPIMGFLYGLPTGVKAIVTTREQPFLAASIHLAPLTDDESKTLITEQLKDKELPHDKTTIRKIRQATRGIPLAMLYTIGRLQPDLPTEIFQNRLQVVLDDVKSASGDLCRFCFEQSFQDLQTSDSAAPPSTALKLLMSLAIFPSGIPDREFWLEVSGCQEEAPPEVRKAIDRLQRMSLIHYYDRYLMHELTREYTLAAIEQYPDLSQAIHTRQIEKYLQFTADYGVKDWGEWHQQYDQIEQEWCNILATLEWCKQTPNQFDNLCTLWKNVNNFADLYSYWDDRKKWLLYIEKQARLKGNLELRFFAIARLLWTYTMLNDFLKAEQLAQQAEELIASASLAEQDYCLHNRIVLLIRQRHYDTALELLDRKDHIITQLRTQGELDHRSLTRRELTGLYDRGKLFLLRDRNHPQADKYFRRMIQTAAEIDWRRGMSYAYYWLAQSQIKQGNLDQAQESINVGMAIAESNHHKRRLAYYKYALARLKTKQGAVHEGEQLMEESLKDFKHLKIISGYDSTSVSSLLIEDDISKLPSDVRFIAHPPS